MTAAEKLEWIHDDAEDIDEPIPFALEPLVEFCNTFELLEDDDE